MDDLERKHTEEERQSAAFLLAALAYTEKSFEPLVSHFPMTQELWERCLWICIQEDDIKRYNELWESYPEFADNLMQQIM